MLGMCVLAIGAVLVAADDRDPVEWVRRLGSDRFAERLEAAKALERLGPAAVPALRAARDSANPKVRAGSRRCWRRSIAGPMSTGSTIPSTSSSTSAIGRWPRSSTPSTPATISG